ncbi:MAG: hypothetical protein KDE31_17245 [Caldilineaceae bacterium]|nr:hypothetical protein [Caldilineaceae bacterium]MCB0186020.1 hypothetical protein [Caldilineaceae bacterium]
MNEDKTSPEAGQEQLTQHAMLVLWGAYAQQIGLVEALEQVRLRQKSRTHRPQTKIIEFLLAMLAGLPHLKDLSHAAHPLVKDQAVAEAWCQPGWADHSGVNRTLHHLNDEETQAIIEAVTGVDQPFIDQECERALATDRVLVYDGDLTGRPVSNTSTSYPGAAFGYMGDGVSLGYQAALVSLHSPTYGRLWLVNQLHAGDTVSATQAEALVLAAEARTGYRPRRRTELVADRLRKAAALWADAAEPYEESYQQWQAAKDRVHETKLELSHWMRERHSLEAEYARSGRVPTAHCKLTRVRRKVATYEKRLPRVETALGVAERRLARREQALVDARNTVERLHQRLQQLVDENQRNPSPIRARFRLDGGFASAENIAWLIEMGYDVDTKARSTGVRDGLLAALSPETLWQRVGGNAMLTAWTATTADGYFTYPVDLALARYQTGTTVRHAVFVHYSDEELSPDLAQWFHRYNGRQTIEAGIKEGKNIFQMHHLKVRSPQALRLQEHFAAFAANFVRIAARWLAQQQSHSPLVDTASVKHMVQVCAHTSALVSRFGDVWLLTFTAQSRFAGSSLRIGNGALQLPLPLFRDIHFCHF